MLEQILYYLADNGITGYERILAVLLPVVCFSMPAYMLFSCGARKLIENRKGGILRFLIFSVLKVLAIAAVIIPWAGFLYLAIYIAFNS